MTLQLVFFLTLVLINVAMAFTIGIAGKSHKQVIIENTLPKEHLEDAAVLNLVKKFRRSLWVLAILGCLLGLSLFFLSKESFMMTSFWLCLLFALGGSYAVEIRYIRKMHDLKVAKGWQLPVAPVVIDTKLIQAKNRKLVPFIALLPAFVLTLLYCGWLWQLKADNFLILSTSALGFWILSVALWFAIKRLPVRPITKEAAINQQLNDITKHTWSLMMVTLPYFLLVLLWLPQLSMETKGLGATILAIFFPLLLCGFLLYTVGMLLHLRKRQDQLLNQVADYRYTGEDQYWRFAMYNNPNDSRIMVPDRIGLNIGINLGRPMGKVLGIGTLLVIFGLMIGTLIPLYQMDFVKDSFSAQLTYDTLTLDAPFAKESHIPLNQIQSVELVDKLPPKIVRTNGYGGDHYLTGEFKVADKKASLYLTLAKRPYLHVVTKNRDYYFSSQEEKTTALYQEIQTATK
ncbi:PH domain-containing protein [Enterococcus asini]|uniref:PH domain-containing protein n=1 Tax=Enterococcus asini TaxID=57732 RepID=UPI0028906571|nr:PH domain-containing protein [Enterococcus asini]MDT2756254.1 PH domain-containing protein [Enterococcus asini]